MQLDLLTRLFSPPEREAEALRVGGRTVPLRFARHPRARRYVLRLDRDGAARVTVPRGGTEHGARAFAGKHLAWLEKQLLRRETARAVTTDWRNGTEILFRGERFALRVADGAAEFADQKVTLHPAHSLRAIVERQLRLLAAAELPVRVAELTALHGVEIHGVQVRNQRSRWGSCSARGVISLNWRLVQTPEFVRDYIILHELMHRRQMNHSARFWREVERVCPAWREAEQWLKQNRGLLR